SQDSPRRSGTASAVRVSGGSRGLSIEQTGFSARADCVPRRAASRRRVLAEPGRIRNRHRAARTNHRIVAALGEERVMRNYRNAFVFTVVSNIALVGILGGLWWRSAEHKKTEAAMPSASTEAAQNGPSGPESASMAPHETSLVPVQLSPERLQSIGVRMGRAERKMVRDEIRATGNAAVDETKLAYVQVRYSGYIQKVFADATYQYLRKGHPLFTIYSPDLTATEREYLVAKQNQQRVAGSTVPGVAESAASLLDAAAERLKQWG